MNQQSSRYYVTTSIPYVNAEPHIGHAYEFIIADVLARYHKLRRDEVLFNTGLDEHGSKIEAKATELGIAPQQLVDKNAQVFVKLIPTLGVQYTHFIRTTDIEHQKRVALIWRKLKQFIYKEKYSGLYDIREETFITEEEAKQLISTDPERYDRLEKIEEENYFFKLSTFTDAVKQAIVSNRYRIVPNSKRNEMLSLLENGLKDISISRPTSKVSWGIPVPDDPSQTIYVWFDALMNYITTLGYPDGDDFKNFWPCNTQVVGKDIMRFHAVIWPAMLLALGLELPTDLYVHGFITLGGEKMSKSVGNVIAPSELVTTYGTDATRYYLMRHIPSYGDGDFTLKKMEAAYNNELGNELGNLVQRVATMVQNYLGGEIGQLKDATHDEEPYHKAIADYRFDQALDHVWVMIKGLNQYIDEQKPWMLAKQPSEKEHLMEVLIYVCSSLVQLAELLAPFMPSVARIIYDGFSGGSLSKFDGPLFPRIELHK